MGEGGKASCIGLNTQLFGKAPRNVSCLHFLKASSKFDCSSESLV